MAEVDGKKKNWSGLRNLYTLLLDDETEVTIQSNVADVVRWERSNKRGYLESGTPSAEQMLWTAWAAGKRTKILDGTFEELVSHVVDFAVDNPDEDTDGWPDPTQTDPLGG